MSFEYIVEEHKRATWEINEFGGFSVAREDVTPLFSEGGKVVEIDGKKYRLIEQSEKPNV